MTVELALAIVVAAAFCCYLVWKWQEAAVDGGMAPEPYPVPVADKVELDTPLNPKAAWPFPSGDKP